MEKYTIAILFCLLIIGCDKDPRADYPYYEMDENFKAYFANFGEGSTYYYIDTVNNVTDTMIVTKHQSVTPPLNVADYNSENYVIDYDCSVTEDFTVRIETFPNGYNFGVETSGGSYSIEFDTMATFPSNGSKVYQLDSLTILNQTYQDVLCIEDDIGIWYERLYFAKDIGIILKETKDGGFTQVYYLVDYKIEPL